MSTDQNEDEGCQHIQYTEIKQMAPNVPNMGKDDRKRVVLEFMEEHPLAMNPKHIYRNLKLIRNITFSVNSVRRYLTEFVEEGFVIRIDPQKLDEGDLVVAGEGDEAYYIISDDGRNHIRNENN